MNTRRETDIRNFIPHFVVPEDAENLADVYADPDLGVSDPDKPYFVDGDGDDPILDAELIMVSSGDILVPYHEYIPAVPEPFVRNCEGPDGSFIES